MYNVTWLGLARLTHLRGNLRFNRESFLNFDLWIVL